MLPKYPKCEICGMELKDLYCTEYVCAVCCKDGECPCDLWCIIKIEERRRKQNE